MKNFFMDYKQRQAKGLVHSRHSVLLLSAFALCLLLLSACSIPGTGDSTASNTPKTPTATPTPTIDSALRKQGDAQLKSFQQWIGLMQQYGGSAATFQQQYTADQQAMQNAKTDAAYRTALATLNSHIAAIKFPATKTEAFGLQNQLQQKVASWGQQHKYHDSYNNTDYSLGYEYASDGIGGWAKDEVNSAQTMADYQQAVEDLQMYSTNFQAMTTNSSDKTPSNQMHQTDLQLMQHYDKMNQKVVVISLQEQAVRVYDHGKLVKAFLATTGRPNKPSLPGVWWVEVKQSPTVFKSGVPKGSPDYYPDTPINYAMQYHSRGYFIHDAWWRANFGPGTNYPHQDDTGDPFSSQGSHGCINIAKDDAGWLYGFVQLNTSIIIY